MTCMERHNLVNRINATNRQWDRAAHAGAIPHAEKVRHNGLRSILQVAVKHMAGI